MEHKKPDPMRQFLMLALIIAAMLATLLIITFIELQLV